MNMPSLLIGFIISSLMGALFHVWRGGGAGKLILYLVLGWAGFWIGHYLAVRLDLELGMLGALRLGPALVVGMIFLLIGHWLSLVEPDKRPTRRRY